ncbi:MAG: hypothetical protein EXQ55_01120 [Acidobacteria bacterium]|nr:hypothetical protein [Acidobacteriota bacterium]
MTLTPWQRASILAALNYLKDLARVGKDARAEVLTQGRLEVLEPARRTIRLQREAAQAASAAGASGRERRTGRDRRAMADRRSQQLPLSGTDRRTGRDRRAANRRGSS